MTPEEALKATNLLSKKIQDRKDFIQQAVRYLRGEEGRMRFASDEFKRYFEERFHGFSDNWCLPVAQAPVERLHYLGMRLPGQEYADDSLARAWERNDADRGLSEALLMMTAAKRSFALVSPTKSGKARITFENPDSAAVIYDAETRERKAGLVVWQDDEWEYGQLHLPASVLAVKRRKVAVSGGERHVAPNTTGWVFDADHGAVEQRNPLETVGLIEFRNMSLLDNDPLSDISQVMPMQDAINLVWAYTLNDLDYMSLPGRVVTNGEIPTEPILDAEGVKIGERPMELDALVHDRIAWLQGQGISIDEWKPADISGFSKIIEQAIQHIAAQTRTPAHYLLSRSDVPATGYELAEAGLVSKANERKAYATPVIREINRLVALAEGNSKLADAVAASRVLWAKTQYRSEQALMDGLIKLRQAGFPFQWIAEEYGLSPDDVKRVMEMVRAEAEDPYLSAVKGEDARAGAESPAIGA